MFNDTEIINLLFKTERYKDNLKKTSLFELK